MKQDYKIYAKALVLAIESGVKEEKIISNFLNLLKKRNMLNQAQKIIDYAEKLLYEKLGKKKIIVEVARPQKNLIEKLKIIFEKDDIYEKINPKLIAGLKIIINDYQQFDFSLKNKLEKILN